MLRSHYYNTFKKLGLCFTLLIACSANVSAANVKNEAAKPAAPAPHVENNAAMHGAPRVEAAHGDLHGDALHRDAVHGGDVRGHYAFRDHDVHRFGRDDLARWQGGRWNRTCYSGRCGWWWFASGQWYFYDQPVYPYPLVVSTVEYVEPVAVVAAPMVVQAAPAPMMVAAPPKFWYYCDNPRGYYPSVGTCSTQFHQVTTPPPN